MAPLPGNDLTGRPVGKRNGCHRRRPATHPMSSPSQRPAARSIQPKGPFARVTRRRSSVEGGGAAMKARIVLIVAVLVSCAWTVMGVVPADATTPGTNGRIAFQMDFGRGIEIYTIRPNGLGIRQLTKVHGTAETPDWSPDGTR